MMNTTNNYGKISDQISDETNYTINANDLHSASQSNDECCCINCIIFSLMVFWLFCLFGSEPNLIKNQSNITDIINPINHKNQSNITEIFNPLNQTNTSSI